MSQGRYPFMALLNDYLAQRRIVWSETTYKERERKYRRLSIVFKELEQQGKTDSMNPLKFGEKEVYAFEGWMRERKLDPATKAKYRGLIKDFLAWNDNFVYEKLIRKGYIDIRQPAKEIKTINYQEFQTLLNHASQDRKTWPDHVAYFMIAMYGYLGLRVKELHLADVGDLDIGHWTFTVMHPKGEGKYGKKRALPIVNPLRPVIQEYLEIRAQHLQENGAPTAKPLIPAVKKNNGGITVTHYNANRLRTIAEKLSRETGIDFQLKMLRASCGQFLKDMGADIETVSKFLGHSSTKTTERFYCRLRDEHMFREINSLFKKEGGAISPLIGKDKGMTGYA
ncbi:MAG: site-specific integrase [Thermoplasmata archaeon]